MTNKVVMWHKEYGDVEVYDIKHIDGKDFAFCFVPTLAGQQNGQGWLKVKLSKLIPYPHAYVYKTGMSKTEKNKIKSMLTIQYAEWVCTDGTVYTHDKLEDAIQHQKELVGHAK